MKPHAQSYALLPYESNPFVDSHPDRLATFAYLAGLDPAPIATSRVLELGCAGGGNLIPAAEALPRGEFVGVDMAPNQIADGNEVVQTLGMKNVRLEVMSLCDVTADFGQFDYVIAHGLYSWVPPEVRKRTMEIIKSRLSARGIAYVSYNTLPGWYRRAPIRDMLLYGAQGQAEEAGGRERLTAARTFAEVVLNAAGEDAGDYAHVLRDEVGLVIKAPDGYIAHDHMEQFHEAVYFHQFISHAADNDLAYVGDARFSKGVFLVESRLKEQQPDLFADRIRFEQALDFAYGRQFRRSLLCHAGQTIRRDLDPARVMQCHLTATVFPQTPIELRPEVSVSFQGRDGGASSTADPIAKAALGLLAQAHPLPVAFDALWEKVRGLLQLPKYHSAREQMAATLLSFFICDSVDLHLYPPSFVTQISPRPVATSLARLQAARGQVVHNRRHRTVRAFNDLDRTILQLLDGTRDLANVRATVRAAAFPAGSDEQAVDHALRESLQRLAVNSVLIG